VLDLTDCQNLISLPLGLLSLRSSIFAIYLYGCQQLKFPPLEICVKIGVAFPQENREIFYLSPPKDNSKIEALLDYMVDPETVLPKKDRKEKRVEKKNGQKPC